MAKFLRQVPDDERPPGDPVLSATDQNAKTDVLERLIDPIAPDATTGTGGYQQRRLLIPGKVVMVRLVDKNGLGGGKYWGWVIPFRGVGWGWDITQDLNKEQLGSADPALAVQVWYQPEMKSNNHWLNFSSDPEASVDKWDVLIGVVTVESAYGNPIVIAITSPTGPIYVKVTGLDTGFPPTTCRVKPILPSTGDVDASAPEITIEIAQRHVVGDTFYIDRPRNISALGSSISYFEILKLPIPGDKYRFLTPIDDTYKWQYTNARFPND